MAPEPDIVCERPAELVDAFRLRFEALKVEYADYRRRLTEISKYQPAGRKLIVHFKNELKSIVSAVKGSNVTDDDKAQILDNLEDMSIQLADMEQYFPRESNGLYLDIILGQINVSIFNKLQRFRYKDDYEKFKLRITLIICTLAPLVFYLHLRTLDAIYNFFLVWYYCTLTIRERILKCNGSRIKGWWLLHHYISAVLCGILLTWPDGVCYQNSRFQLLALSFYLSFVQILQCQYQRGCLYRLRTLGRRHSMDITIEGFHSWMFRGLTFLLPFLVIGYLLQLYAAYCLYVDSQRLSCHEWQVNILVLIFFCLAVGNSVTTGSVCWQKLCQKEVQERLKKKFRLITDDDSTEANDKEE